MNQREEIGRLYKAYSLDIFGVAFYVLKDKERSKDIVLEVFEVALRHEDFSQIQQPKYWLMSVAKNLALNRFKKDIKLRTENIDEVSSSIFMENDDVELLKQKELLHTKLLDEIALLKSLQSRCIDLFYLQNKSYKEIAEQLNLKQKEVKSHIQNGKRNLKNRLQAYI